MNQQGFIVEIVDDKTAKMRMQRHSACASCGKCAKLTSESQDLVVEVDNQIGAKVGDHVEKGQLIGIMGRTGSATGVHLDFRVFRNDKNINPFALYYKTAYPCYGK